METRITQSGSVLGKCKVCGQYLEDIIFYEETSDTTPIEEEVLKNDRFSIYADHEDASSKGTPCLKLTSFMIYDKFNHLCAFDTGLMEKGIALYFSGYIKTIDDEEPSPKNDIFVQNVGPIKEWWVYGFDGGEKLLIGLSTPCALYYLMEPSDLYEDIFQNLKQKVTLSKIVIDFLVDFGHQNPTLKDLIQHIKNFNLPEVEELLFREAQFLCNQIMNYDFETTGDDDVPMISLLCIDSLIKISGIKLPQKIESTQKGSKKQQTPQSKIISTKLVRGIFEKCFSNSSNTDNSTKDNESTLKEKVSNCYIDQDYNEGTEYTSVLSGSEESENSRMELGEKPVKHKECSKLIVHNVKFLKKTSTKYNDNQGYSSAIVDEFKVEQDDFVMLRAEEANEPLRIAKVCYMYDSPINGAIFHAHFFCRGRDTILGHTANPKELFIVDDCDEYPLGSIVQKTEVKYIKNVGDQISFPFGLDSEEIYFFSKIYDYEVSRFRDYIETDYISEDKTPCMSCKWQTRVRDYETAAVKDNCVIWRNETFTIGSAVFLEPGQNITVPESGSKHEDEKHIINDKIRTEIYRKTLDTNKGSNADIPEPFTIGLIEDLRKQKNDIKVKVRMFYRPEDTVQSHFLAYVSDINYLFWADNVIWTTFKHVAGKCYVTYIEDKRLGKIWSEEGPFRFYYSKAYDYRSGNVYDVPLKGKIICNDILIENNVRLTRSTKSNATMNSRYITETPTMWQQIDQPLKCLDIYAGCGGLSEGLHQSGVAKTIWAIEKDTTAAQSYQMNNPNCRVFIEDCNDVLEALLCGKAKYFGYPDKGDVDLLVGGPPCQGYSTMNRFRNGEDSCFKNSQIATYLSYCDYYRPKYFILENVRNFVSFKKSLAFKLTLKCLLAMGYQICFGILQAGHFGIPQTRRRFIMMGAAPGYALPNLPEPLHVFSRSGTFLSILVDGLRYDSGSVWSESLPYRTVCVRDAIADLPEIKNGATDTELPYDEEKSHFQKIMRRNVSGIVTDHICKKMSEIVQARISRIPTYPGADWRDLPNIAIKLSNGSVAKVLKYPYRKKDQSKHDPPRGVCKCSLGKACDISDRQSNTLIPWFLVHTADKHNNWVSVYGRLEWDGFFGTTITNPEPTGTQGRVLHPDQHRVVSVRECARSQGFPDHYKFSGNILDKHRQIGNAVPPPLSLALGREIIKAWNTKLK